MNELLPIATAPKDGTFILLFGPSGYVTTPFRCEVGRWIDYGATARWMTHANDNFTDGGEEPTHWLPLPKRPEDPNALRDAEIEALTGLNSKDRDQLKAAMRAATSLPEENHNRQRAQLMYDMILKLSNLLASSRRGSRYDRPS